MTISDNRSEREAQAILDTLTAALIAWVVAIAAVPAVERAGWRIGLIVLTAFVVLGFVERGVVNFYLLARQGADGGRQNIEFRIFQAVEDQDRDGFEKALRKLRSTARLSNYDHVWAVDTVATVMAMLKKGVGTKSQLTSEQQRVHEAIEAGHYIEMSPEAFVGGQKRIFEELFRTLEPFASAYFMGDKQPSTVAS